MPARKYLRPREIDRAQEIDPARRAVDRPRPRGLAVGFLPRVILPPDPPKRSMGSGEVAVAIIVALLCALIVAGLGWFAAGLF